MTEYVAAFAPDTLSITEYTRVDEDQAKVIREAMEQPEHQANFEVTFLPVETLEQRQAAATEWAAYKQAVGEVRARESGAAFVFSTRDESPETLLPLLENKGIQDGDFVTSALLRVVKKTSEAKVFDLLRGYFS